MKRNEPIRRTVRLTAEFLELREVLSYGINLQAATGLVVVGGTTDADMVRIDVLPSTPAKVAISLSSAAGNQQLKVFLKSAVSGIRVDGNGGDDYFVNRSPFRVTTTTSNGGTVSASVIPGSPANAVGGQTGIVGVFTAGSTGNVNVDYLYRGTGYAGQMGFYSLNGMEAFSIGSDDYKHEAARRILSDSPLGGIAISAASEAARFSGSMPWEGATNSGTYAGVKTLTFASGSQFAAMIVPNGTVQAVFDNPASSGSSAPLFSIPEANPYAITPQLRGQIGDVNGHGSLFAFEDLRLDAGSDRDYDDLVFQVTGARGVATPVADVINAARNMYASSVGASLLSYALVQDRADASTALSIAGVTNGTLPAAGVFTVGPSGQVAIDFRYDGGGYAGQLGIFSLEGMGALTPGSTPFAKEALRRAMSETVLGHLGIDDIGADAAAVAGSTSWDTNFNQGSYNGPKTVSMLPGDRVAFVFVPNSSMWTSRLTASPSAITSPLYSFAAGNPGAATQMIQWSDSVFGFEDHTTAGPAYCDRDFNDLTFRATGLTGSVPGPQGFIDPLKDLRTVSFADAVFHGVAECPTKAIVQDRNTGDLVNCVNLV